jgi:hypothetical protein
VPRPILGYGGLGASCGVCHTQEQVGTLATLLPPFSTFTSFYCLRVSWLNVSEPSLIKSWVDLT